METESNTYRIVRGPMFTASRLAIAPRHARLEDAVANMGDGMVVTADGSVVAFHERHLVTLQRLAAIA